MRRHLQILQLSLPQLRASFSLSCKGPLLFFILRKIHDLNSQFHSALLDTKNHKYFKLTGACHPTEDLPHHVLAAIGHVATFGAPTVSTDDITSAATRYTTSGTANAIDTAADAAASITEANTDIEDAAATNIQDLLAYIAPPTTDVAPPTTSTASSSRGDCSTQPCRVFTIPP
eukprot:g14113.t1